ncbi:NADH-quinone oxidoreductase subunit B [Halarcobacter anaerophilus]|jgi:NADH-quinone oxidoreductase subunit B|uniref:NADH-quinone oxidoreductase subunit B n=1 Tax=Halarcobacter anaerophilus TaxID=877500 RepID=A0A4Q0XZB9_9BACT|nr:NADH-quinone oxidoreductase subunit NuoB [Halarcobacter anaerophilus]QDF29976.1 NADH:quinone oxidoreductase I, chain B [Halarcobacter anaerophilus]RXJ63027.1 NADH-quinone oxidoreductase subunit B [Halarcobacter anaerophilus]
MGLGAEANLGDSIITTKLDSAINWARSYSMWPMAFGTACCGIEFMSVAAARYDVSRFGAEVVRFSPRQADLLIVAGTITYKQAPVLKKIWDQMCEPKWVISMGACACSGGFYDNYTTLQGIDEIIPVDEYIAGCPPRPEAVLDAIMRIQEKSYNESIIKDRERNYKGILDA